MCFHTRPLRSAASQTAPEAQGLPTWMKKREAGLTAVSASMSDRYSARTPGRPAAASHLTHPHETGKRMGRVHITAAQG